MSKAPLFEYRKNVLDFTAPLPERNPDADTAGDRPMPELRVGGRRYRLVPVDPQEAPENAVPVVELLTPREFQIVALIASGHVNKQVADVLRISEWTVSTHLRRIFAKLGVDTRAAMVSRCFGAITVR
jgi:DNA-binding CsgD family transcriptional regulator